MEKCPLHDALVKLLNNCQWVFWKEVRRSRGVEREKAAAAGVPQEGNASQREEIQSDPLCILQVALLESKTVENQFAK